MNSPAAIARFNRLCALAALLWLVVFTSLGFLIRPTDQDFRQYYMGALMARHGEWKDLYPTVRAEGSYNAAYGEAGEPTDRYLARAAEAGVEAPGFRFIQPPVDALLVLPLAYFRYHVALTIWITLLIAAMWGISLQAGATFQRCTGRMSRGSGVAILVVACSVLSYRAIRVANLSPIIGWCLGATVLQMLRKHEVRAGIAAWLGAITKYVTVALIPLAIILQKWRALAVAAALLFVSLLITLIVARWTPFGAFLGDIVPTLGRSHPRPANQSIEAFLLRVTREPLPNSVRVIFGLMKWISLIALLAFLARANREIRRETSHAFAAAVALIGWTVVFSPIYWEHYAVYFCPFWGWVMWESTRSPVRLLVCALVILSMWFPLQAVPHFTYPEPLNSHILWGTLLLIALALTTLTRRRVL